MQSWQNQLRASKGREREEAGQDKDGVLHVRGGKRGKMLGWGEEKRGKGRGRVKGGR